MGLDVYLYKGKEKVNINSKKYPKHLFKVGYFRSSYNGGGFNTVLSNRGIPELHWMFNYDGEKYEFKPDWDLALERVQEIIVKWKAFMKSNAAKYTVMNCMTGDKDTIKSDEDALKLFFKEKHRNESNKVGFDCYSNSDGTFFFNNKPLKVCGIIYGTNCINARTVYMIHKVPPSTWKWYLDALEVVEETIKYVLAQKDKKSFKLHWSG